MQCLPSPCEMSWGSVPSGPQDCALSISAVSPLWRLTGDVSVGVGHFHLWHKTGSRRGKFALTRDCSNLKLYFLLTDTLLFCRTEDERISNTIMSEDKDICVRCWYSTDTCWCWLMLSVITCQYCGDWPHTHSRQIFISFVFPASAVWISITSRVRQNLN